jgi:hypothetical protein
LLCSVLTKPYFAVLVLVAVGEADIVYWFVRQCGNFGELHLSPDCNYHTASQTSKQYQLLQQQQALKQQSKALLEQSKAKHQAMIAQAHAVQKANPPRPTMKNVNGEIHIESAIQKYAPKPPIQPSHCRKQNEE